MTVRPRVKICGITRQSDAALAVSLGADAIGFVFWAGSPRAISPAVASEIQATLPPLVTRVGVFVNMPPEEVRCIVRLAQIDVVQLHGDEEPRDYEEAGRRILKVASLRTPADADAVVDWPAHVTPLVDAVDASRRGGTGRVADWTLAVRVAAARPILLAGGLTAANIQTALAVVRPWGVDVSSGVEDAPGIKSPIRLREFFAASGSAVREDT